MKKLIVGVIFIFARFGLAHGGDKPGPHGGFVEMPAAFHTEVVPESDGSFRVYLIDMEFKNPSVKDSNVEAWLVSGSKKSNLKCEVMRGDHFHCSPADKKFKANGLVVKAMREKMQGNEAKYKIPLKR